MSDTSNETMSISETRNNFGEEIFSSEVGTFSANVGSSSQESDICDETQSETSSQNASQS